MCVVRLLSSGPFRRGRRGANATNATRTAEGAASRPLAHSDVVPEGSLYVLYPETLGSRVGISLTGGVWGRLPHAWRVF